MSETKPTIINAGIDTLLVNYKFVRRERQAERGKLAGTDYRPTQRMASSRTTGT